MAASRHQGGDSLNGASISLTSVKRKRGRSMRALSPSSVRCTVGLWPWLPALLAALKQQRLTNVDVGSMGWCYGPIPKQDLLPHEEMDAAHPSKTEGQWLKALPDYAIEAVKISLSGSMPDFAGDVGAVLTRRGLSTNLQCGPQGEAG